MHCGVCSLRNWLTNCPSLINELLHCSFSGECPGFRRLFKALDGTPSVRPEPFHCFCHPAQSDRGLGKNGSFSRKSCKIYRFAEFLPFARNVNQNSWSAGKLDQATPAFQLKEKLACFFDKPMKLMVCQIGNDRRIIILDLINPDSQSICQDGNPKFACFEFARYCIYCSEIWRPKSDFPICMVMSG